MTYWMSSSHELKNFRPLLTKCGLINLNSFAVVTGFFWLFAATAPPTKSTSVKIFPDQLSLGRERESHGCDVFGFVNPYTFSELKNPRFWPVAACSTFKKGTSVKIFDAWCPNSSKYLMRDSSLWLLAMLQLYYKCDFWSPNTLIYIKKS